MKKASMILLLLSLSILMSCASNIKTIKYMDTDLTSFKTFTCFTDTTSFKADEFKTKSKKPIEKSLISSINAKMIEKGFSVNEDNPNLLVFLTSSNQITSGINNEKVLSTFSLNPDNFPMPSGPVAGFKRYTNNANNKTKNIPLNKGDLVIEVFNRESKELVWVGIAKDFKSHISDQTLFTRMIDAVFKEFPN